MKYTIGVMLLLTASKCTTFELKSRWDRYYDPKLGTEIEDIQNHFNLHRGRWWNYYDRGSVYLAYGHFNEALEDFNEAIVKRSYDKRDARSYGMHFIDYFPHRESGVTYYLRGERIKGELKTDVAKKERLIKKSICELQKSLDHEESSRAKFYLNKARMSLLQVTKEKDKIPPKIHVKKPIYTNSHAVQFEITVTDQDSYVKDIRIGSSCGDVKIDRPRLFVELAKKKVEDKVELTVGPNDKYAVVTVTATDLAGNESDPDKTLIIVDKQAPTAGFDIVSDNIQLDSPVEVSIEAMDSFGLKQIQVGDDPNDKIDCDGAMEYSCNITGKPKAGKLAITIVDNAGNVTNTSIPVEEESVKSQLARAARPRTSRRSLLTKADIWNRSLSPDYSPAPGFPMPRNMMPHKQKGYTGINSLAAVHASAIRAGIGNGYPTFDLPPHVHQLGGKETSQDIFYFDGTLLNAQDVNNIEITANYKVGEKEKKEIEIEESRIVSKRQNIIFSQKIDITNVPLNIPIDINVKAYCDEDETASCAEKNIIIRKRNDYRQGPNAIYEILFVPLRNDSLASTLSDDDILILGHIYNKVFESLRDYKIVDGRDRNKKLCRFKIHNMSKVGESSEITEWFKLRKTDYLRKINKIAKGLWTKQANTEVNEPNIIDLIVYGDVKLSRPNGEECFQVNLYATNISARPTRIRFPGIRREEYTYNLADVYGSIQEEKLKWYINMLAFKVVERFPRFEASITNINEDKGILEVGYGQKHRLFHQMKFWLFEKPKTSNGSDKNAHLEPYCLGKIISLDWASCKIKSMKSTDHLEEGYLVITK